MNFENFATNLSNESPAPLPSKTNLILVGFDEKAKNNFLNFYIEKVLIEDATATVFYLNNLNRQNIHPRVALMEDQFTIALDYLFDQFSKRKKRMNGNEQIYVVVREINDILNHSLIKYKNEESQEDSYASKLGLLINEGYAVNINFILNLKEDNVPRSLKTGFLDVIFFKTQDLDDVKKEFKEIKKENQFYYSNNLFVINESHYPFKIKDEKTESILQKDIKKYTSKVLETDLKILSNDDSLKNVLIKLFCNYGATSIEEPNFKMSEISFNFEYNNHKYSVFIYHPGSDKQLENAIELASHLEKSSEIIVVNLDKDNCELKNVNQSHIFLKRDIIDLIKFKIDEEKISDEEIKKKVKKRLKFFN